MLASPPPTLPSSPLDSQEEEEQQLLQRRKLRARWRGGTIRSVPRVRGWLGWRGRGRGWLCAFIASASSSLVVRGIGRWEGGAVEKRRQEEGGKGVEGVFRATRRTRFRLENDVLTPLSFPDTSIEKQTRRRPLRRRPKLLRPPFPSSRWPLRSQCPVVRPRTREFVAFFAFGWCCSEPDESGV